MKLFALVVSDALLQKFNHVQIDSYNTIRNPRKFYDVEYRNIYCLNQIQQFLDSKQVEMSYFKNKVAHDLRSSDLKYRELYSRIKSPASIFEKMSSRDVCDILAFRVICDEIDDIYEIASFIRLKYDVVCEKNYISKPKKNGYRSLHLTCYLSSNDEFPIEFQLRTTDMDFVANFGNARNYK